MRQRPIWIVFVVLMIVAGNARAEQTIVFMRHGEKPSGGLGQLTCQGFNRALELPTVLVAKVRKARLLVRPESGGSSI